MEQTGWTQRPSTSNKPTVSSSPFSRSLTPTHLSWGSTRDDDEGGFILHGVNSYSVVPLEKRLFPPTVSKKVTVDGTLNSLSEVDSRTVHDSLNRI